MPKGPEARVRDEVKWEQSYDHILKAPRTQYLVMSIQANQIKTRYSVLASAFSWTTLAGFITLPNTFTSLQTSSYLSGNESGIVVQNTIRNLQLLPFAGILCFTGIIGTCFLWRKCRMNYIWLIKHLFLPGLLHSLISLFSTVLSILTTQGGYISVTAKVTITVILVVCGSMLCLFIVYNQLLRNLIALHKQDVRKYEEQSRLTGQVRSR
ncbi:hypothetical protein B0H63DRAFT_393119 [Podospora didyma]|uniref:Uncharacterized protein n=1 Tax=Podospora didyma TaxID=330526 RepID=A0AAE0NSS1_9PEZI|nr:hypothetical protein B0H63DRAFT_393119 [Podospora didyma]